jgi:hypothetical protein
MPYSDEYVARRSLAIATALAEEGCPRQILGWQCNEGQLPLGFCDQCRSEAITDHPVSRTDAQILECWQVWMSDLTINIDDKGDSYGQNKNHSWQD